MDQHTHPTTSPETVAVPEVAFAPDPHTVYEHPSTMTIRIYDVCPEHGAHTDPELQQQDYAEHGI